MGGGVLMCVWRVLSFLVDFGGVWCLFGDCLFLLCVLVGIWYVSCVLSWVCVASWWILLGIR